MLRTGRLLHPASPPASRPTTEVSLPGTLASPRTGLTPAGCRELLIRLRQTNLPYSHGVRTAGHTWIQAETTVTPISEETVRALLEAMLAPNSRPLRAYTQAMRPPRSASGYAT